MILDVYVDDVKTRRAKFLDALEKHVFAEYGDGRKLAASTKKDVKEFGLAYEKFQTVYLGVKAAYEEVTSNQTIAAMKYVCSASESVQGKLKTVVRRIKGASDAEKEKVEKGVFEKLDVLLDSANRWKLVTDDYEKAISRIGMGRNFLGKDASLPHETMGWPFSNKKVVKDDSPIDAEKACAELTEQFKYLVNDTAWPKDLEEFVGKLEEFKSHVVKNLLNRSKRFVDLNDAANDVYWALERLRSDVIPMVQKAEIKGNAKYRILEKIKSEFVSMLEDIYKEFPGVDQDRTDEYRQAEQDRIKRNNEWKESKSKK